MDCVRSICYHGELIEPYPAVPVTQSPRKGGRNLYHVHSGVQNDEVISQPMHLHEGQSAMVHTAHGGHIGCCVRTIQWMFAKTRVKGLTRLGDLSK
ncbi:hypothetical protein So717_29360 [Roseobacter cerasinus]|uniref:Uncharacterized protein n=1 Tax=Roseobacter cerasinus TaxID=2602289 RepID=A0A640VSJ4_9RHOB|nr:hypothetical protein So717_29360 [Roseobacter cerasinus]